ncbi:MAG: DUF5686 family protein [Chitinophagales bacterium]
MVSEAKSGEPIPFCNITVPGKFTGTSTDVDGKFSLQLSKRSDSITVSAMGYKSQTLSIANQNPNNLKIALEQDEISIGEISVSAEMDPAKVLFRRIIKNKANHDIHRLDAISYEVYNKYEVDLLDVTPEDIQKKLIISKFPILSEYIDSLEDENTTILPLFMIENIASIYKQNNPRKVSEKIQGVRVSGVQRKDFIAKLLSNVDQNFNIYDNLMVVFGKNFISPIADYGMNVYRYNLNVYDTLFIQGVPHFEMEFEPKRKGEYTFRGSFIVNIKNYAIASIEAEMVEDINIELVKALEFKLHFAPRMMQVSNDSSTLMWLPDREFMKVKMNYIIGAEAKILGKKTTSYKDIKIDASHKSKEFNAFEASNIVDQAGARSDSFWQSRRHMDLEHSEQGIYDMVDSLKRTRTYKVYEYLVRTATSGYVKLGGIGLGAITSLVSRNALEGWRFRLGFKTNTDFSERVLLRGYAAYGLQDERIKYGGEFQFIISKRPWNKISISARTDVDLMTRHAEEMDKDNVFTIIQKPNTLQRLYNIDEYSIVYDTEFHKDVTAYFSARHRRITPGFDFLYESNGGFSDEVKISEAGIALRWQHKSRPLPGTFNREASASSLFAQFRKKNSFPVFHGRYTSGFKNVINSDFEYHDVSVGMQGDVRLNSKMSMYYNLWAGKIYGTLPFLLLKSPEGNFSYIHNKYLFNNMNILEFVADQYVSLNFQYFIGGSILDKIPGIKKLKWREVLTANVFYGNLRDENKYINRFNEYDVAYPVPYVEAGFGFENIFKVIRIDSIWRITHRDKPQITNWALYLSLYLKI